MRFLSQQNAALKPQWSGNTHSHLQLCAITPKFVVVNKPSGIQCNGTKNYSQYLLPQLYKLVKEYYSTKFLSYKVNPLEFKLIHRLDRFVSGGLIVARKKYASTYGSSLSGLLKERKLTRRYVGLISVNSNTSLRNQILNLSDPKFRDGERIINLNGQECDKSHFKGLLFNDSSLISGHINFDIKCLAKDDRKHQKKIKPFATYQAQTNFRILYDLVYLPSPDQKRRYPHLYAGKTIYPIVFELVTGRKNQIRDHVLQAFGVTLLNDDKFPIFKYAAQHGHSSHPNLNSEVYHSNQIGLHSAYLKIPSNTQQKEYIFPFSKSDQALWFGFLNKENLREEITEILKLRSIFNSGTTEH